MRVGVRVRWDGRLLGGVGLGVLARRRAGVLRVLWAAVHLLKLLGLLGMRTNWWRALPPHLLLRLLLRVSLRRIPLRHTRRQRLWWHGLRWR